VQGSRKKLDVAAAATAGIIGIVAAVASRPRPEPKAAVKWPLSRQGLDLQSAFREACRVPFTTVDTTCVSWIKKQV
jgi:hypothetical protein